MSPHGIVLLASLVLAVMLLTLMDRLLSSGLRGLLEEVTAERGTRKWLDYRGLAEREGSNLGPAAGPC